MKQKVYFSHIVIILAILILPILLMNHKKDAISDIDNEYYPAFPSELNENITLEIEEYVKKRIGFRDVAINSYTRILDKCFHEVWPNTMYRYGKDGHIFAYKEMFTRDYQHINQEENESMRNALVTYFDNVNKYLAAKEKTFVVFLVPEKHTIYPEFYIEGVNTVDIESNVELFIEQLNDKNVPLVYPYEDFIEAKKTEQIYNVKYDAYHWNDLGNLLGNRIADDLIRESIVNIQPLEVNQFELKYENRENLMQSYFEVNEEVPVFYLKNTEGIEDISQEDEFLAECVINYWEHFVNNNQKNAPKILIFHDSYFGDSTKYYKDRYSEVITVHATNYMKMQELVEQYNPDVVLFESAERVTYTDNKLWNVDDLNNWKASY